jgi:hypothetical protein
MDLLFDADGRPSGAVWAGASVPHPVLGWLELMSELTRLLSADATADVSRSDNQQGHEETR